MATNYNNYSVVGGSSYADYIYNYGKYAYLYGYSGNDYIVNYAGGTKVYGGYGNDTVYSNVYGSYTVNSGYGYVTLDGGYGNDSIYSADGHVSVSGGTGADTIKVNSLGNAGYNTIYGGTGNDYISVSGGHNVVKYYSGDGYDTVYGIGSTDTISLSGSYSTVSSNSDIIIYPSSGGSIRVKSGYGKGFKIRSSYYSYDVAGDLAEDNDGLTATLSAAQSDNVSMNTGSYANYYNLDASQTTNNLLLVGNSKSNSIIAGSGNSTLWGGNGTESDTLIGGSGNDTFLYYKNNGNDVIANSSASDVINLANIMLADIGSIKTSSNSISLKFNNGQTLTVNDSGGDSAKFLLGDGSSWKYSHTNSSWTHAN